MKIFSESKSTHKTSTKLVVVLGIGIIMKSPLKLTLIVELFVLIVITTLAIADPLMLIGNE
jgi:hypothetical protein